MSVDPTTCRADPATLERREVSSQLLTLPEVQHTAELAPLQQRSGMVDTERLEAACRRFQDNTKIDTVEPFLPVLFNHEGKPLTLQNYFPFEPLFRTALPKEMTVVAGRQVAKSSSLASRSVALAAMKAHFSILYIAPLFEMTRRFSTNYVRPLIDNSPVRRLLVDTKCNRSVLQRTFKNHATIHFSFAYLDPNRIRGLATGFNQYDEAQDLDPEFVPIINETMSGSPWAISANTGTPKTFSTYLNHCWRHSSQAEWHIICIHCGYENIPSKAQDLDRMIGPDIVRREISEDQPGVVCSKCQKPIYPRLGRWVHHLPERRLSHPGYHIPQILLPIHYADPDKWVALLGKRMLAPNTFYNEVCGEPYDVGAKLISESELREACTSRPNSLEYVKDHTDDYIARIVSVDWGGGGETQVSRTVIAAMGLRPDYTIDVVFARRFRAANDFSMEAAGIKALLKAFKATHLVHDMGGQGVAREEWLIMHGITPAQLVPVVYVPHAAKNMMRHVPENSESGTRNHYQLNKTRSLLQTCEMIRYKALRFYECDYKDKDRPGLIFDFLSLIENVADGRRAGDSYMIIRGDLGGPDDFAQTVNIGCCALYYMQGQGGIAPNVVLRSVIQEKMKQAVSEFEVDELDWGLA